MIARFVMIPWRERGRSSTTIRCHCTTLRDGHYTVYEHCSTNNDETSISLGARYHCITKPGAAAVSDT